MLVAGVSEALAAHLGWSVTRVRWSFVGLSLFGGAGVLLYLWMWVFIPLDATERTPVTRSFATSAWLLGAGAVAAMVAIATANSETSPYFLVLLTILLTGAAVAWSIGLDREDPSKGPRYRLLVRSFSAGLLVLTGVLLLLSRGARPDALTAVLAVFMIVLGAAAVAAPSVVRLWTDLMAERAGRVREEQRAEIAAHLHDSVLQTLAVIQNRAGTGTEVARLARAQERELRDWLFGGTAPTGADLATDIRDLAGAIEIDFPVRIEVVATGEESQAPAAAVVAATREAMLNAARHAGGDVSVYIETTRSAIDVFVRDRGPGVDLTKLPADRLGIRESIIGRMARAGGQATVSAGVGGVGTQVHLHVEASDD
nr:MULTISPECIES: ATP-binding protein [unclassified Cryobacterium]